jgi:hypothetical protein
LFFGEDSQGVLVAAHVNLGVMPFAIGFI